MDPAYSLAANTQCGSIRLTLVFVKQGDRFGHQFHVTSLERSGNQNQCGAWPTPVATSDEGDSNSDWPTSPPLQELHEQEIDGKQVIFGVGMAGTSHWSCSVEPAKVDQQPGFLFDVACRTVAAPEWLGSSYRMNAESGQALNFSIADDSSTLHPPDLQSQPIAQAIQICPDFRNCKPGGATLRWKYFVSLVG